MRVSLIPLVAVMLVPAAGDAQFTIRPGEYEIEMTMDLGSAEGTEGAKAVLDAAGFQKNRRRECIDQVKANDVMKLMAADMEENNCKMSDNKTVGNKQTFTLTCVEDGQRMVMTTEMTFGADTFSGVTKGKDPDGRPINSKVTAKRVGECGK